MSSRSSISSNGTSVPSFVQRLDLEALASLATQAREGHLACVVEEVPKFGAFNVVYFLKFSDGVRWVARIPIAPWSEALSKRMSLDRVSLDFIGTNTTIPVPKIIDCQTTEDNALGRPYTLTTFLPGTQLAKLWFDPTWFTDQHRATVFQSLATLMSQLSAHEFPSIGQLNFDETHGVHFIGPFYPSSDSISDGETSPESICGPYQSTHVCLLSKIARQVDAAQGTTVISELHLLRTFAGMLPDPALDGAPFFLSHPDFGYQNILVDAEGNVTGIIDWDDAVVGPRQSAFARYPSWITRDWDPLMYTYRDSSQGGDAGDLSREAQEEDSPETLARFREEYLAAFTRLDPRHAELTRYSHLAEALEIAIQLPFTRADILSKFTEYVYSGNDDEEMDYMSFNSLSRRLSLGSWLRDTVGEDKLVKGGKYI
ncbi:kinase-like domain-containing protein [Mycena belliarum]|uniref:Kinase-like domain-containing protein n=1 Tax=Mycena belliarum TaxID=1033014 RepID=A0AAD6UL35_9AGAR|nr:kinase-like domain-containing protein [Mycena belliae]